ncbi:hypothetical protein [Streptomyces sp. NBC_01615]|uniref:hypothetical protein n=1 Tax=Streptomyces sp. NBC_01615 TaxID=2975898 RepID=UPI00386E6F48
MRLRVRLKYKIDAPLPVPVAFRWDLVRPLEFYSGPMNGQARRQQLVRDLMRAVAFDEVVETGTYRGVTSTFLSNVSGLPVHTAEMSARFFRYSRVRCADDPAITVHHSDSRRLLRELADRDGDPTLFFYLDAHWQEDVPRYEELEIIHRRWSRAVVVIDDFRVNDDPGYGHETYHGVPLDPDYLPQLPGWRRYYPAARSFEETGMRRGCLILASPALTGVVDELGGLRPAGPVMAPAQTTA